MNITLKDFQKERVHELLETAAIALNNWRHYGKKQIISFTAPTGSGKTIMMAKFIEDLLRGDEESLIEAQPESIILWLSDAPELNKQTKQKLMKYCNRVDLSLYINLDSNFRGDKLDPGKIYFLNTQKLRTDSKMTTKGDGKDYTMWEIIENTIEEYGNHLVLIIDEAHRGAKTNETSTMQKFVKGFKTKDEHLQPLPFIIGMSATPERFNALAGASLSTLSKVVVEPAEVRDSGLLKDRIEIHFPEESVINKNIAVLQAAADEWKDKCVHWKAYTEKQQCESVYPIFVVQVEAGTTENPSATNMDECLQVIEKRTGESFEPGEVVHAFSETGTLTINNLEVPYCQPSAINDDTRIKVVFFKDALSTGWDCPRAEAMMSFRVARDATYIAQLLGRMIRTPKRMRIEMDESLNYVHLYLPNFDESTVVEVVKKLTEEEGGVLPTEVKPVRGGKKKVIRMTVKRPRTYTQPQSWPQDQHDAPLEQTSIQQNAASVIHSTPQTPPEDEPQELKMITEKWIEPTPKHLDLYEEVRESINNADILTYHFEPSVKIKNHLRALFDMARLGVMSGMDETYTAVKKVKDDVVKLIHNYIVDLKKREEYDALVDKALELQLNTISLEFYKSNSSYDIHQGPNLFSRTDAGLQHQFQQAEVLLCGEGISQQYIDTYEDESDETACMYDVILYAADEHQRDILMSYASKEFDKLADLYRPKSKNLLEKDRIRYNNLASLNREVTPLLYKIQEETDIEADEVGEVCTDHLFVNAEGKATFNLEGWEPLTLAEERKNPNFVCWLRNQERKTGSLCIKYEYGKEEHPMYPDFLIVRRNENGGYSFGILEPHMDNKKDNLAKAQGLVQYVQACPAFDRVQMLRKKGNRMLRLELTSRSIQKKVMACQDDIAAFDTLFNEEGFFE